MDRTYVGGNGNFLDADRWDPVGVPTEDDVAIIESGTVTLDSNTVIAGLTLTGGTLDGSGTLGVTGPIIWRGGFMAGAGNTNAVGGLTIEADAELGLRDIRALNNFGDATWTGDFDIGNSAAARLVNAATANFSIETSADFLTGVFINQGTLTKVAGDGDGQTRFTGPLLNSGLVDIISGSLEVSAGYANTTTGVTRLNGGALNSTTPIAINGGRLQGNGTIAAALFNAGIISPGLQLGEIGIDGTYRQTSAGRYAVDIGGGNPGQFDRLTVSGAATLDGTLAIRLINGFMPENGATFEIMTFASHSGDFANTTGLMLDPVGNIGGGFRSFVTDTSVVLQYDEEVCDDGQDNDGDSRADCDDPKCAGFSGCLPTPSASPTGPTATVTNTPTETPTEPEMPPTETPTSELTPATPTATGDVTPPTETPTGEITPPTETPTGEITPPTETPTGEVTPPTATPTDDFTPEPTATVTVTGAVSPPSTATVTATPTTTATPFSGCVGDCDASGAVVINELIRAVSISLGLAPLDDCVAVDADSDGSVAINEIITAVNNALTGCSDTQVLQ